MGHGGKNEREEAVLCFERDNGALELISAREFTKRLRNGVFLVTLNACESAEPGENTVQQSGRRAGARTGSLCPGDAFLHPR
jgi:hypothetical protein